MNSLPSTIPAYLAQLRRALEGADPALVQDALYDAEEYLRSELAENPGKSEAEVIATVASSYGKPEEVADIYRDTEVKVQTALRPPRPRPPRSVLGRFFGVVADPRAYTAMFYMLLALLTGTFYFTWVVAGFSLSLGLSITIIGLPLLVLFFGSVRLLSLVEGRLVEVMLGERMPRRPLYSGRERSLWRRIGEMFTDPRSWSTMAYLLLMLPLGVVYFTLVTVLLISSLTSIVVPFAVWFGAAQASVDVAGWQLLSYSEGVGYGTSVSAVGMPILLVAGVLGLFALLHISRGVGWLHGNLAKHLLVRQG